ncbi:MAG: DUF177 domain-containing protein [Pseudomonadota bacterium]
MTARPEFSRPIRGEQVPMAGVEHDIEANEKERAALAERFGLLAVNRLTATVKVKPFRGGQLFRVTGRLSADVVQACVVTLEPVPAKVVEDFQVTFGPESGEEEGDEVEISLEDEDFPDPMVGGIIDIGEVVAEHLALGLDPFPRARGAKVPKAFSEPEPAEEKPGPFAALARLRQKKE